MDIQLTYKNKTYVVKYSTKDHTLISKYKNWCIFKNCSDTKLYVSSGGYKNSMHRMLMNFPKGLIVDHINGDGLDNRRENLRTVTVPQNSQNKKKKSGTSSIYKGLSMVKNKTSVKYNVKIRYDKKKVTIGRFSTTYTSSAIPNPSLPQPLPL